MKVLLTGGCGFVGVNLIDYFAAHTDAEITVYDNESLGTRAHLGNRSVAFIHGDVRDRDALRGAMEGCDAVVHLAAHTRVIESMEDPRTNFEPNVIGSFNVFEAARDLGIRRIVNASSGGTVIGDAVSPMHEDMLQRPISPYGASKLAAEGYAGAFNASFGLAITTLRFSNLYGRHSIHKGSVVAAFFRKILNSEDLTVYGDGSQVRDYLYVDDIAELICRLVTTETVPGVFQLGTGEPTDLNRLIALIRATVGDDYPFDVHYEDFRPGEVRETYGAIDKAVRELGYAPKVGLEEGLRRTWDWFTESWQPQARAAG